LLQDDDEIQRANYNGQEVGVKDLWEFSTACVSEVKTSEVSKRVLFGSNLAFENENPSKCFLKTSDVWRSETLNGSIGSAGVEALAELGLIRLKPRRQLM